MCGGGAGSPPEVARLALNPEAIATHFSYPPVVVNPSPLGESPLGTMPFAPLPISTDGRGILGREVVVPLRGYPRARRHGGLTHTTREGLLRERPSDGGQSRVPL